MDIQTHRLQAENGQDNTSESSHQTGHAVRDAGTAIKRNAEDMARDAKRTAEDLSDTLRDGIDHGQQHVERTIDAGKDMAEETGSCVVHVFHKAQDMAIGAKDAVVATAAGAVGHARDTALGTADKAREGLSDVGERLARNLEKAAERTESPIGSRALDSAAQGVDVVAATLRDHSFAQLGTDVGHLARRHPAVFAAGAALLGYMAARAGRHAGASARGRTHGEGERMVSPNHTPPTGARALVGEAVTAVARVVDGEVRLAAHEARISAQAVRTAALQAAVGLICLVIAGHAGVWAGVLGLMAAGVQPAVAAAIVAIVLGGAGALLCASARASWPQHMWTPARLWRNLHTDLHDITYGTKWKG